MKNYIYFIVFILIFVATCLFLCLNQECYAVDNALYVTLGDTTNNFQVDISQAFVDTEFNFSDYTFTNYYSFFESPNNQYVIYLSTQNFYSRNDYPFVYNYGTTFMIVYSNSTFHNFGIQANGDLNVWLQDYTYLTNQAWLVRNTEDIFSYATLYVDSNYLTSSSDSGGEVEDNGLLQGIKDFFVGLFIPNEEQFNELQEDFSDKITSKFQIVSINRNGISYDNNDVYDSQFHNQFPVYTLLWGYELDSKYIYDVMHTPLDFGKLVHWRDNYTQWVQPVHTGGATLFDVFNIVIAISVTYFNIRLYNKFLEK